MDELFLKINLQDGQDVRDKNHQALMLFGLFPDDPVHPVNCG